MKLAGLTVLISASAIMIVSLFLFFTTIFKNQEGFIATENSLICYYDKDLKNPAGTYLTPGKKYKLIGEGVKKEFIAGMITRNLRLFNIETNDGRFWCSENIIKSDNPSQGGRLTGEYYFPPCYYFLYLGLFFLSSGLLFLALGFLRRKAYEISWEYFIFFILLWIAGINYFLFENGGLFSFSHPDPQMFYMIAREWLSGWRSTHIPGNVGTAYFYLPFVLLLHPENAFNMLIPYNVFNSVLVGSSCFLFTLCLLVKFNINRAVFFITGVLLIIFFFFSSISILDLSKGGNILGSIGKTTLWFGLRDFNSNSLYHQTVFIAWNGLSDSLACLFILFSVIAALNIRKSICYIMLSGFFFGFSICLRYSSVAILPAILFLLLVTFNDNRFTFADYSKYLFLFLLFLTLGFLPQLLDNYFIQGNVFNPYVDDFLLKKKDTTFYWVKLFNYMSILGSLKFYLTIHFKLLLITAVSLFFIKNRKLALFLWLWIISPILFYSFFPFITEPVRYLIAIFPCVFITIGLFLNDRLDITESCVFISLYIIGFILVYPESPYTDYYFIFPLYLHHLIPVIIGAFSIVVCRLFNVSMRKAICFFLIMLVFSTGIWLIIAGLLFFFPCYQISYVLSKHIKNTSKRCQKKIKGY